MMSFSYIVVTVMFGCPILSLIARHSGLPLGFGSTIILLLDALIYVFLPQLNMLLLRLVQGRPLIHRLTGRSLTIGDVPWVAQALDAMLSKILGCTYSATHLTVMSANPADHLVHRHTHRVVRGSLLACGRPDGRLVALTSAENAVCLSVNQASSIQSLGGTCESLTIGHNPFKLPLSAHAIFLPDGGRKKFLCEEVLDRVERKQRRKAIRIEKGAAAMLRRVAPSNVPQLDTSSDGRVDPVRSADGIDSSARSAATSSYTHGVDRMDTSGRTDSSCNGKEPDGMDSSIDGTEHSRMDSSVNGTEQPNGLDSSADGNDSNGGSRSFENARRYRAASADSRGRVWLQSRGPKFNMGGWRSSGQEHSGKIESTQPTFD